MPVAFERLIILGGRCLALFEPRYRVLGDDLVWAGERPGPGWHAHGWLVVRKKHRFGRALRTLRLRKRRWVLADRSRTTHSRPPDDLGLLYDALTVALELWCWLDLALGLHRYQTPFADGPARRTVQRWLDRALPFALDTQSAIRRAVMERSEPRPMEALFRGGLSPPVALVGRRWKDPTQVEALWRGLSLLFSGADQLDVPATVLLAEARGRRTNPRTRLLF